MLCLGHLNQVLGTFLLRGTILNTGRTYGKHKKKLDIDLFLLTIFGPIYYGPP